MESAASRVARLLSGRHFSDLAEETSADNRWSDGHRGPNSDHWTRPGASSPPCGRRCARDRSRIGAHGGLYIASGPALEWTRSKNPRMRAVPPNTTPGPTSMVTRLETRCGAAAEKWATMRPPSACRPGVPSARLTHRGPHECRLRGSRSRNPQSGRCRRDSALCVRRQPTSTIEDGSVMRGLFHNQQNGQTHPAHSRNREARDSGGCGTTFDPRWGEGRASRAHRRRSRHDRRGLALSFGSRKALIDSVKRFSPKRPADRYRRDPRSLGRRPARHAAPRGPFPENRRRPRRCTADILAGVVRSQARRVRIDGEPDRGCASVARTTGASAPPTISDTRFVIALLSSIHAVMPVAGDALLRSASAEGGELGTGRFLNWVANLLDAHLNATEP